MSRFPVSYRTDEIPTALDLWKTIMVNKDFRAPVERYRAKVKSTWGGTPIPVQEVMDYHAVWVAEKLDDLTGKPSPAEALVQEMNDCELAAKSQAAEPGRKTIGASKPAVAGSDEPEGSLDGW